MREEEEERLTYLAFVESLGHRSSSSSSSTVLLNVGSPMLLACCCCYCWGAVLVTAGLLSLLYDHSNSDPYTEDHEDRHCQQHRQPTSACDGSGGGRGG